MLILFLVYIFYPSGSAESESDEIQKVSIDFLDVDPSVADSLIPKLSDQELILQHIIWRIPSDSNFNVSNLLGGGFIFDDEFGSIKKQMASLDSSNSIRPYYFLNPNRKFLFSSTSLNQELLNNSSKKVLQKYLAELERAVQDLRLSGFILPFNNQEFNLNIKALKKEQPNYLEIYKQLIESNRNQMAFTGFNCEGDLYADSSYFYNQFKTYSNLGLPLVISNADSIKKKGNYREHLKSLAFNGLVGVSTSNHEQLNELISNGADFIVLDYNPELYKKIVEEIEVLGIKKENLSTSIKRNLLAKTWMRHGISQVDTLAAIDSTQKDLSKQELISLNYAIVSNSNVLINNKMLPLANLKKSFDVYTSEKNSRFLRTLNTYTGNNSVKFKYENHQFLGKLKSAKKKTILLLENINLDTCSTDLNKAILDASSNQNVITVVIGNSSNLIKLNQAENLIYISNFTDKSQYLLAKQLCGVSSFTGNLAFYHENLGKKSGSKLKRIRIGQGRPEEVGLNSDTLSQIDYLVKRAISGRAFPGCQVLVMKNGQIVYDKNFGYQTYDRVNKIDDNDVYDIASLTKVVSTTMAAMKLYEMKAFGLTDSLYRYLPEDTLKDHLRRKSSIRNIRFDELLIHKSGLPAGAPIIQYLDYIDRQKEIGRYDRYYCDEKDDTIFCVEIAKGYYLDGSYIDSMWLKMNSLFLNKSKPYKYSDVNMNLLYRMFKSIISNKNIVKQPRNSQYDVFTRFVDSVYYQPLKMKRTSYLPRERIDTLDIVPSENDKWWRKQILRGYVHDPNAALYGGIAGNAGIFSNTKDLAILFQMLLDGGVYDGTRYLKSKTIELFTQTYDGSHRGLGFNKQTATKKEFGISPSAPVALFGHTGFTGTCAWADPENDILLIFLSNRVYPKVNKRIYKFGVRKNIHDYIYRAMIK
jgi:CubicO group peptidase (beta-lactamase class C family)